MKTFLPDQSNQVLTPDLAPNELLKNLERLNTLSAQSRSYAWEINLNGLFTYMSPVVEIVLGYKPEQLVGKKYFYDILNQRQRERVKREAFEIIKQHRSLTNFEKVVDRADGTELWVATNCKPLFDEDGNLRGYMGSDTDISVQKQMQQKMEEAIQIAENSAKAKETFLTNMSHEIRTPLNVIIGMIREIGKEALTANQKIYLKHAESSSFHLLSIVNNVLDMSKIEAGEFKLDIKDFSLSAVLSNVKSILSSRANGKKIDFKVECSDNIAKALRGDSLRLSQVLINLLGNSIKFTDKGSVVLKVNLLSDNSEIQKVSFEVADTGIGMSEEYLKRIFKKFTQEYDASNRAYEGTGLGMSISKQIIEMMGGQIAINSKKGQGTNISFSIDFPVGIEENLIVIDKNTRSYDISGTRVLLVEDNEMNRFIARQSLLQAKCILTEAINGKEAIDILRTKQFDLILMDIQMPEMDGVEATKIIREELNLKTAIIALTANAFKHDIDLYMSIGMDDYLIKPYKEEELFAKVEQIVRLRKGNAKGKELKISNNAEKSDVRHLYSLRQIEVISGGDKKFVATLIAMFLKLSDETIQLLNEALESNNIEQIKRLAHKIKPSLDNLEVNDLHNEIRLLEQYNPVTDCPDNLRTVVRLVTRILTEVNSKLRTENL
ncbi:MAG: ATP-binding protein [Paludibacter sp.]